MLAAVTLREGGTAPKGVPIAHLDSDPTQIVLVLPSGVEGSQSLSAPDGDKFSPIPELKPNVASHLHVSGPSGSGKSSFADLYANNFKRYHPGGRVVVISADTDPDPNLTHVDARVGVDESIAEIPLEQIASPPDAEGRRRPTLVILDDVEGLPKPKAVALRVFTQGIKERGRKLGLHSLSIYHKGASNLTTRDSLSEATSFVVFPHRLNSNAEYMLKKYAGIPPEVCSLIRRGSWGHWLIVTPGQCLLGEKKAAVVDPAILSSIARAEKVRLTKAATQAVAAEQEPKGSAASQLRAALAPTLPRELEDADNIEVELDLDDILRM